MRRCKRDGRGIDVGEDSPPEVLCRAERRQAGKAALHRATTFSGTIAHRFKLPESREVNPWNNNRSQPFTPLHVPTGEAGSHWRG